MPDAVRLIVQGVGRFALRFTPQGWVGRAQQKIIYAGWAMRGGS